MAKILSFQKYLDKRLEKKPKQPKQPKEGHMLSKVDLNNLSKLSDALLFGEMKTVTKILKRREWTIRLILNPVEYEVDEAYMLVLYLDPMSEDSDIISGFGDSLEDCMLEVADAIAIDYLIDV